MHSNFFDGDLGYQVLGGFSGKYMIWTDNGACTKNLLMVLKNDWSVTSATRNPYTRQSFLSDRTIRVLSIYWGTVHQEYRYEIEEPLRPKEIPLILKR